jgi:hypothetical protein
MVNISIILKKMLQLFKQGEIPGSRQKLAAICSTLTQLHPSSEWKQLIQVVVGAIANSDYSYQISAPLIIKELKQAGELLSAGRSRDIVPSQPLLQLVPSRKMPSTAAAPTTIMPLPIDTQQSEANSQQITIPVEPQAAVQVLCHVLTQEQRLELAELLMKSIP